MSLIRSIKGFCERDLKALLLGGVCGSLREPEGVPTAPRNPVISAPVADVKHRSRVCF